jgi:hypothetical protein
MEPSSRQRFSSRSPRTRRAHKNRRLAKSSMGSPPRLLRDYNQLVESYNRGANI